VVQNAHGFAQNQAVYLASANTYALARANDPSTAAVSGVVREVVSANSFILAKNGAALAVPLAAGVHWLSASVAGQLTTNKPTGAGTYEVRVVVSVPSYSEVSLDGPYDNTPLGNSDFAVMPANTIKANLLEASATPQDATYAQLLAELFPGGTDNQVLTRTETGYAWENAAVGGVSLQAPQVISSATIDLNTIPHLTSWTTTLGANWNPNFTNLASNVGKRFRGYITNPSTHTVTWANVATLAGVTQSVTNKMDVYEFEVLDANRIVGWRIVADIPADAIAPTVTAASINEAGTTLTLTFSEAMAVGAGGSGGFTLGGVTDATLSAFTLTGGNLSATMSISRAITAAETPTLAYTQPGNGLEDLAGNDLATFTGGGIINSSTVAGYLVSEDFEGTGAPAGWTVVGSPNFDYATAPAPLEGTQSVLFNNGGLSITRDIPPQSTLEGFFKFNCSSLSVAIRMVELHTIAGGNFLRIVAGTTGAISTATGTGTTISFGTAGQIVPGQTYNVWWRYVAGTGSDGVFQVWLSDTETKPGSPTLSNTVGTWTQACDRYRNSINATGPTIIYDKIRLSATPIGSNPA
jgi:hypothetical protein